MERLWTRPFVSMTLGMLFLFTGFYLLLPTLPLFIKQMAGDESKVGLVVGVFTLAAVVCRPFVGGMLDRFGRRPFMIGGLLFFTLAMCMYNWASGIALLIVLRILHGMSWAASTTAVGTTITDIIPPARRGEGMGWFGMAMTVAMAIGPMLGIWVVQQHSFRGLFLIATGLSIMALLLALISKVPFQPKADAGRMAFFDRSVGSVSAAVFFLAVAYGGITTFLPLFSESIQVNAGTFFLVYAITLTAIRPVAGKMSDRHGEAAVIIPALGVTIVALIVLSLSTGLAGVIAAAILYGIGFGSAQPALQAAALRMANPDRRGVANASFLTAFDLGIGVGAIALGAVVPYIGYAMLFTVSAVSVAASLLIFAVYVKRILKPQPQPQPSHPVG